MDTSQITVVFQGMVNAYPSNSDELTFAEVLRRTREVLPNAKYILSTWNNIEIPKNIELDFIVTSDDPGGLPGIKFDDKVNNVNRQIVSTLNGIRAVKTKYTIKMRTDAYLEHAGFIDLYKRFNTESTLSNDRIVVNPFFTLDPTIYEHIPYHISDWFQFAKTDTLLSYWNVPLMDKATATYYDTNSFAKNSGYFDKKFRVRYAVEQYISLHYAKKMFYPIPQYHNDINDSILEGFRDFLARYFIVIDPWAIGLAFPKYYWAYDSYFQWMNCIMHLDWLYYARERNLAVVGSDFDSAIDKRIHQKQRARIKSKIADPIGNIVYSWKFKRIIFWLRNFKLFPKKNQVS